MILHNKIFHLTIFCHPPNSHSWSTYKLETPHPKTSSSGCATTIKYLIFLVILFSFLSHFMHVCHYQNNHTPFGLFLLLIQILRLAFLSFRWLFYYIITLILTILYTCIILSHPHLLTSPQLSNHASMLG